jgi:CubicO group peptidase (beta-lactamase class C family)
MNIFLKTLFASLALLAFRTSAEEIDDYLTSAMQRQHIPGLSIAVIKNGETIKTAAYGQASIELHVPATTNTVFELASLTKPFVAAAIMLLVQDQKLALDDPISRYIDKTPIEWRSITIRHLLSHTSGIKDYLEREEMTPWDLSQEKILEIVSRFPLQFPPGEKWAYSNSGYVLLGMIIENASGQHFHKFIEDRILQPLQMRNTTWHHPDGLHENISEGYLWLGPGGLRNSGFLKYMASNRGDAGILSTVTDIAKFANALRNDTLLKRESRETMWTPMTLKDGPKPHYALGWFVDDVNGHPHIYHPGQNPLAASILSFYPDDKLTVILLANGGGAYPQGLDLGLARILIPTLMPKAASIDSAILDACSGYYNAYGSRVLTVTREGSNLFLNDGGNMANLFLPLSETKFIAQDAERGCEFHRATDGAVSGMRLRLGVDEMEVQRMGPLASKLQRQTDPHPARTTRIETILKAFAKGGAEVERVEGVAPQARKDFARGPAPEFQDLTNIKFIAAQNVTGRGIRRHDGDVAEIIYFQFNETSDRIILIYLTPDRLVTDQDVMEEKSKSTK